MVVVGLILSLAGVFLLLYSLHLGEASLWPIAIVIVGIILLSLKPKKKELPKEILLGEKDGNIKKVEKEIKAINKWQNKDHH